MTEPAGRWAALGSTTQFAGLRQRTVFGPGPASYLTTGVYSSFEVMVRAHGRDKTPLRLSCAMCSAMLWACFKEQIITPPPPGREWEATAARQRVLLTAFDIQTTGHRAPVNQPEALRVGTLGLACRDTWWVSTPSGKNILTRWDLGVQHALEEGVALPVFRWRGRLYREERSYVVLESDPVVREQLEQDCVASGVTEIRQIAGSRHNTPAQKPGIPRTRSKVESATPEVAVPTPSNERGGGSLAKGSRGRSRG